MSKGVTTKALKVHEGRSLYAIACERLIKLPTGEITIIPEIVHCHALDHANAKFIFLSDPLHANQYRIVAIGPVVGFHVEDNHGEKLRA